ncbi:MAG: aspartyl/asparaginyl beta-hydroxylase domain-containing protein [Planctomycetota bacterium]|nr:aspartyl/asparaginyl beta-hydroxylase domain-containing protein [Planctomycetota bacterium]
MVTISPPVSANTSKSERNQRFLRSFTKVLKRTVPPLLALYFIPWIFLTYLAMGFADVLRNRPRTIRTMDRYFAGNGVFTWLLSPFNLLMDLFCLPYWNRGIYRLQDLPEGYRSEIQTLIDAAADRNLVGLLESKMQEKKRGMIFFKWYGTNISGSVEMPEYHQPFKYIRTIGVSIFNKRQSTGEHFGPLRVTLRVLYNINDIDNKNVYIKVGDKTHYWQENKLFIFDDTLQHQSCNESDAMRYCLFVDILRPSPFPWLMSGVLTGIRLMMAPLRAIFYKHWTVIK